MPQLKFALGSSAAVAMVLSLFVVSAHAQNIQAPTGQTQGFTAGAAAGGAGLGAMSAGGVPSIRAVDPTSPFGAPALGAQGAQTLQGGYSQQLVDPLKPNDFQKYVLETTGFKLPLYGQSFFDNVQSSQRPGSNPFAPVDNAPVTSDYPLGPGDQVIIRGWGSIDIDVRTTIDRNGMVTLPRVGAVQLAGVKAGQAEGVLHNAVGKYYKDFQLSVSLGSLRSITVYVVGQARRPGSYTLSSVSTLASGLFATGGPNANGSMRRVQLKRAGQVVTELDLYSFLSQGSNGADAKLIDGDVIFIPPATGHIALVGKVNNPAVYELKSASETLEQLLSVAGGVPVVADPRRVTLERINANLNQPRSVEGFALDAAGLKTALKNGDLLTVQAITPEMANAVTLRGNVAQATRLPWREGMRVTDLIPNKEALISRDSIRRQNEALFDSNQRERALREREMIPDDLLADPTLDLKSQSPNTKGAVEMRDARQARLFAQRNVQTMAENVGNQFDEVNFEYALIERLNRQDMSVSLVPFNLGRVLANAKDPDNQVLQPGDVVTVFSVNDMRVPMAKRRAMVRIEGEVASPGVYQVKPGETLTTVLQRAGGLTHDAYLFGASFYREDVRKSQTENLEKLIRRLEAESSASVAQISQSMGASTDASLAQARILAAQQAQRQSIDRVRSLKPEGRIAMDMPADMFNYINKLPDLRLQNGDRFVVPSRPDFVYVFGSVNTESALLYKADLSVEQYLKVAGVSQSADRDGVILIRADGSAITSSGSWGNPVLSTKVMPGDTIVLPEKLDREATWSAVIRNTKDITQILYQLGLGAAAYKTLRN
ncbi:polysaccharide export protein [Limnohabitans sp. TS-CS-82]|uniref:polysaccharide biosynthesis/export family protein n=1 Tax=Limnohabitans sp. TS-CS-82 TaxID=2094193 RepID=UPI000CF233B4|nr:SLBB domain-containing protein [Limnohabitans sp. TS-CS-82]PQA81824.1 polysaccharide export protein [Limnohabitans sp. TS-CS-82]